jgi:hypothetical protein
MDTRVLPRMQEFRRLNFTVVTQIYGHQEWVEITTQEQAEFAHRASSTPVHVQFAAEREANEGRPAPHRWFMLALVDPIEGEVQGDVVVAVPGPGARLRGAVRHVAATHTVGFAETNPYPTFRDDIDKLADAVGIPIRPNFAGVTIKSRTPRLYELLQAYGATKFEDGWRPETFGGLGEITRRARMGGLLDEDADFLFAEMAWYGPETFGTRWKPLEADETLGKERADELRELFAWIDAYSEKRLNSPNVH